MEASSTLTKEAAGARRAAVKILRPALLALFCIYFVKFSSVLFRDLSLLGFSVTKGVAQLQAQSHPSLEREALPFSRLGSFSLKQPSPSLSPAFPHT